MNIYSLFDRKVKEYGQLVVATTDDAIRRAVHEGIPSSGTVIAKYPQDFDLMFLGSVDPETGVLTGQVPRLIANVADLLSPEK